METHVKTFRGIMGNTKYIVPPYQRAYSWGEDLWNSLFNDYREIYQRAVAGNKTVHDDDSLRHFVGAAVMHDSGSSERLIIDGQQRLTTLNILAAALTNSIKTVSAKNASLIDSDEDILVAVDGLVDITIDSSLSKLIVAKESSRKFSSRITLGISDRKIYDELFTQIVCEDEGINIRTEKELFAVTEKESRKRGKGNSQDKESLSPHLRVEMALSFFYYKMVPIVEEIFTHEKSEIIRRLWLLAETLCDGFNLVVITTTKSNNPQDIFESLNARSKPLESFDLLKNYLLMKYTNDSSNVNNSDSYSLEEFYDEYLLEFDNPEAKESEELQGDSEEIEGVTEQQDASNTVLITPFWLRDKATQADRGYATTVNNRTVFLNYWLDALYHPGVKSSDSELTLTEQNTEHRYKNTDSIYKAYKKYFIANGWNDSSRSQEVPAEVESFSIAMKDGGNFYREVIELLENENFTTPVNSDDLDLTGFPALADLAEYNGFVDKERTRSLLYFVEHVVVGLELRALWKQVLWLYRNRKVINNESFKKFIDVLESWAVRRFLFKKYPINNLNTATVNIMAHLLKEEAISDDEINAGHSLEQFLGKVASTSDYLYFPADDDILQSNGGSRSSSLNTVSCLIANSNLQKVKHLLIGINDSLAEEKDKDGNHTISLTEWTAVFAIKQKSKFSKEKGEEPNPLYSTIGNVILVPNSDVKEWNKLNTVDSSNGSLFIPEKREIIKQNEKPAVNGTWNTMIDSSGPNAIASRGLDIAGQMLTRWKDIEREYKV